MGNNLWGGITDSIIAEEGAPASGYFEGQFKEVANLFWVTSLCVLELNTLIYAVWFSKIIASHHIIFISRYYFTSIFGKRNVKKHPEIKVTDEFFLNFAVNVHFKPLFQKIK